MKQKRNPDAGRAAALPAVMAAALLFLAVMLIRGSVLQLRSGQIVSGCVSIVGAVLFLAVGLVLLNDLRKRVRGKHEHQEDSHGQHE